MELAARQRITAERSRIEAEVLARLTGTGERYLTYRRPRPGAPVFGMTSVALLQRHGDSERAGGDVGPPHGAPAVRIDAGSTDPRRRRPRPVRRGPAAARPPRHRSRTRLGKPEAGRRGGEGRQLAEIDRLRSALLAAVGHDLRTPLAGIKAAVSSLRQEDVAWTPEEEQELLATIEASTDRLEDLIANLLAMSRLQAGALSVHKRPVALDEVVARALIGTPEHCERRRRR